MHLLRYFFLILLLKLLINLDNFIFLGDKIYANGAVVKEKDTHATNGVVHKLTKLLTPADLFDVIHFNEPYGSNKNTNYSQIVG